MYFACAHTCVVHFVELWGKLLYVVCGISFGMNDRSTHVHKNYTVLAIK